MRTLKTGNATPESSAVFRKILQHAVQNETPSLWPHPALHHSFPVPLGEYEMSLSLLSESSHPMEKVHSSLTDEHACHLPRFPFHGLSSQMVAERDSPRRALWRMGYSIIHDSTMEREATGEGRCRNLTRILRTECMFAIHSSLFDCWVWLFILCTFFKQNCGESAMSRKFLISMFIVVWRLEVGAWVGMGVSSRFFEIGNFKKMDGDLNFWTELSLISFFGKCNEANSIVSGILFSLLLGAGRLESAPSCVAMMVKAVVQGYLLPTPPTPSGRQKHQQRL